VVSIVTRIRSGKPGNHSSIPGRGKYFIYFPNGSGRFWGPSSHLSVGKSDSPMPKADDSPYVKRSYTTQIPHMPLGVHRSKFTSLWFLKRVSIHNFPYYFCNNAAHIGLLNGTNIWSQYNSCVFLFQVDRTRFLTTTISLTAQNPLANWRGIQMLLWNSNLHPVNGHSPLEIE
jgi:hypothetical protein